MATTIRPEHPDDHAGIEEVNRIAFGQDNAARLVAKLRQADGFDPDCLSWLFAMVTRRRKCGPPFLVGTPDSWFAHTRLLRAPFQPIE